MTELLKLLRDAVGIRPLFPVVLILLAGLLFKSVREYPLRELFNDRWFLLVSLITISGAIAYEILTSGLANRTHEGRLGVYVARLKGDPAGKLHLRLFEGLRANLDLKAQDSPYRIEIRDLKREVGSGEEADVEAFARHLNAAIVLWGTAIDEKSFYPRLWVRPGRTVKSATPLDVTDLQSLGEYSASVWGRLSNLASDVSDEPKSPSEVQKQVAMLRAEVADLRSMIASGSVSRLGGTVPMPSRLGAVLIGIGDYEGTTSDLLGPPNDVAALSAALEQRGASVIRLVNQQVTRAAVERSIETAAESLGDDEPLIVYFSGHTGMDAQGKSSFYLPNLEPIPLANLFRSILEKHKNAVIVVDGGFDLREIPKSELSRGAILSADPSGQGVATERSVDGTHMGSFTWAFVRALKNLPRGIGANVGDVFAATSSILRQAKTEPEPSIVLGAVSSTI
jgi:hypothetical protein